MASDESTIWRFSNSRNEQQTLSLIGLASARTFVSILPKAELQFWIAERMGGPAQSVADCSILIEGLAEVSPVAPPTDANVLNHEPNADSSDTVIAVLREPKKTGINRRVHKRIDARVQIMIFKDKEIFTSCTRNISAGGILIEDSVPAKFVGTTCRVLVCITGNEEKVEFSAKVLESNGRGSRLMFESAQQNLPKLMAWLEKNGSKSSK